MAVVRKLPGATLWVFFRFANFKVGKINFKVGKINFKVGKINFLKLVKSTLLIKLVKSYVLPIRELCLDYVVHVEYA